MGGSDHATTPRKHRTGRILSAHMAGNQPPKRQESPAETAYLHAITDTRCGHRVGRQRIGGESR